jgi:hypothetical protein
MGTYQVGISQVLDLVFNYKANLISGALNSVQSADDREPVMELSVPASASLLHRRIQIHHLVLDANLMNQDLQSWLDFVRLDQDVRTFRFTVSALLVLAMRNQLSGICCTFFEVTTLIFIDPGIDCLLQSANKQCFNPGVELSNPLVQIGVGLQVESINLER